jgi:hypothetical protein
VPLTARLITDADTKTVAALKDSAVAHDDRHVSESARTSLPADVFAGKR